MKVLVAGGGSVGRYMADQLGRRGHDVVIIEQRPEIAERRRAAESSSAVQWTVGDACELRTLAAAGAADADVVAAVTGDDEDNLVVSLLAKQEFAVPRVVARVNNPNNEWMFGEMWGVDISISTPHLLTSVVEEAVTVGSLVRLLSFEGGRTRLEEITLTDASPATDHEIASLRLPRDTTIVAVVRDQHVIVPRGDTVLRAGDEILVLTTGESDDELNRVLVS